MTEVKFAEVLEEVIIKKEKATLGVAFFIAGGSTKQGTIDVPGTSHRKALGASPRFAHPPGRMIHPSAEDQMYP
ncbi:hypothetical protein DFQ04_3685 [Algoriphagus boseongensis]|uniref:Uncharacterized protein n=1 Tax=Algoriphagus boseongensis TaxID=1442587 RepID=A0A4R6T1D1_9BACT|nr:hypothetical protein DFQ04_3685 [Algoriphagus boseongensis]